MKKLGRQLALEQLEDRHMMAGDILTFDGILEDTGFSVRETLYHDVRENIVDGALQMDESVLYVSQEEYVPSEDRPVTFEADITIKSNQLNGMLVAMRSDGETVGQYQTELRNGLTFTIEPTGMSIYDYNVDGGEYIGGGYNHFRQELERDKVYHLVMVDTGSSVRGALYDGETEITSIEGDTHNAIHGGKIILRPQGRLGRLTGTMDNVQISQGEEEEEEVHEEAVDTVFADIGSVLDDVELPAPEAVTIAVEGDTPEQRLLAFQQKVLTLQQQIDALTLEKVDLETDHTRQQALYDEAQELMKQAQEVMEEYDRQHDPEALKVAPSFRVDADRFTPHFFVSYADVPAGYSLQFAGDNVYSLSGSSGRATINYLPRPWNHTYFDLDLLDANGVKVKTITRVKIAGGRVSRVGSLHQSYTLNDLAVAEEIPEDQVISDAAHAEAITQNNDAECAMLEAESAMTALDSSIADLASQIHALEREQIPYNRMFVSPIEDIRDVRERGMFVIKYMSNQPQTYVEVALGQPNNVIIRETMNHPGGTSDTEFVADIRRHAGGSGSGKVMITMYSDDTKEEVLDAFTGSYNGTTETVAGESNGQWGQLETGRIVESPLAPSMSVLRMSGPMVTIAAQTPYDYTTFELDGGGFFSEGALDSEGGSPYQSRMFVMNGDMKSGDYQLHMKDGMNRRDIATMTFHWDRESKKLSLVGDNPQIDALASGEFDDEVTVAQRQIDHIAALDSIDVEFWSLRNVQRDRLYRASTFTKTDSEWEKAELTFPIPGHPDRNGIFHQGLAAWEGAIGELLEVGVDRILSTLHGESQRKAREEFDQAYTRIWPGRYLREFAADFHVDVPAVDALFTEATRITLERNQMLHDAQSKNEQMIKRDVYLANLKVQESDGPGFGGGGLRVGEFERGLRDLARRFGAGSPEYQLFLAEHKIPYLGDTPVVLSDMSVETSQFIFGQELLKVLNQNDWASIIRKQFESNNTAQASVNNESTPIFTWVEQEVETSSYYVSRPLAFPGLGRVASHNFIVTDAKYLGDPDATVFSFGHNDSGDLGMVDYCTINSSSGSTHLADRNAWLSLKDNSDGKIKFKKINASSEKVRTTAFSVIEDDDYAMFSGLFGVNSNSAAHAVANHFEIEVKDPSLRLAPGAGNSDKIRFGFFVRENGCGSGIHFKEDLDSNPIF